MFVPWQVSQTARGRPSSGWTFWLKTSNIFINSPLRFLCLLILIKTKEHTRQRSETFPLGLFTLIVKKPWTFPKQLVEGDMILVRTESHVSVSASCSTYLRGPCDEIISRDWQSFSHSTLCEKSRKTYVRTHWTDKICLAPPKNPTKFASVKFSICQAWMHWDTVKYLLTTRVNHLRQEPPLQRSKNFRIYQIEQAPSMGHKKIRLQKKALSTTLTDINWTLLGPGDAAGT